MYDFPVYFANIGYELLVKSAGMRGMLNITSIGQKRPDCPACGGTQRARFVSRGNDGQKKGGVPDTIGTPPGRKQSPNRSRLISRILLPFFGSLTILSIL